MTNIYYSFLIVLSLIVIASCSSSNAPTESTPVYQLTVSAEPAEGGTVSPSSGEHERGEKVEIIASPHEEWLFDSWQGDHTGNVNPDTVTMNSDKEITALFVLKDYSLSIEISGEGTVEERVVQGNGTGNEHVTIIELTARPAEGWRFSHWEGDIEGNENPVTIELDSEKSVIAVFERRDYPLTIYIEGEGAVAEEILHAMATDYPYETVVQLTANPAEGWVFSHWEGDLTGSENPAQIEITDEKEVTAVFVQNFFELVIEITGEGSVSESLLSGTEIEDGYLSESEVELTAEPEEGWEFIQWEGDLTGDENPATITIDEDKSVTAVFEIISVTLTVDVSGEGHVTLNPDKEDYDYNEEVELTAEPDEGWVFSHWEGDLSGEENPETVLLEGSKAITAIFEPVPVTDEINLVDLSPYGFTVAWDVNDHGHIVGSNQYWNSDTETMIDMGGIFARSMNNNGQVVGNFSQEAVIWEQNSGITRLGTLDGEWSHANDVNNQGQVAGEIWYQEFIMEDCFYLDEEEEDLYCEDIYDYGSSAFFWDSATGMISLDVNGSANRIGEYSAANGINDAGRVVGLDYNFPNNSFIWDELNGIRGLEISGAIAINNQGQILGSSAVLHYSGNSLQMSQQSSVSTDHLNKMDKLLILTQTRGMYDFGHVAEMVRNSTFSSEAFPWENSRSSRLRSSQITGTRLDWDRDTEIEIRELAGFVSYSSEAFITNSQGHVTNLGSLGGTWTSPWDINDHGQVVGYADIGNGEHRAFFWDEAVGMIELPTLGGNSLARAVNNNGQIVGYSYDSNGQFHPVMWEMPGDTHNVAVIRKY